MFNSLAKFDVTESGMLFLRVMGSMYTSIRFTILTKTSCTNDQTLIFLNFSLIFNLKDSLF